MTPRTKRNEPNDRTQRTAARLIAVAPLITDLVNYHRDELSMLGFPSSASGADKIRGGKLTMAVKHTDNGEEEIDHVPATAVELQAVRIMQLTSQREDLRDAITDLESRSHALVRLVHHQLGIPLPGADGEALCCDKQRGRDGAIDWGRPTCVELPTHQGLCYGCYQRERRWRLEHGLTFRGEPAA